jgi:predicted TIM-barrel enzyme
MAIQYTSQQVVERMRQEIAASRPIYTVGAGTGISAKFVEAGGGDLISTYPIAKFRMTGLSSMAGYLPLCDSNATTLEMGEREILPIIQETPVAAGLLGADPTRDMDRFLDRIQAAGFSGILNCPTIALVDGNFRLALEETGLSWTMEVEMIRLAHEKDLFTHAFCSTVEEAQQMVEVGCDMVVAHMGNSIGGTIGSRTALSLDEAVAKIQAIADVVQEMNPETLVICHGGTVASPDAVQQVLDRTTNVVGYMGGSSGERFPVETGVTKTTQDFKDVTL